jgi:hypothetical protein
MIDPAQIPGEVVEAALWAYNYASRDCYTAEEQDIATAIAAALNAWPGMSQLAENDSASIREMAALILPLPQEARDD